MVANNPNDEAERRLLLAMANGAVEQGSLNPVLLTKAKAAGYVDPYGVTMVKLSQAGYERLDELTDR